MTQLATMKRFLLLLPLLLLTFVPTFAERPRRAVFVEYGGLANSAAIFYDARFASNTKLGYSVGLSYGGGATPFDSPFTDNTYLTDGGAMALEINHLFGKKRSFFDFGVGMSLGFYQNEESSFNLLYSPEPKMSSPSSHEAVAASQAPTKEVLLAVNSSEGDPTQFGMFFSLRASYRYQAPRGLFFRVGVAYLLPFGGVGTGSVTDHPVVAPHIGLGLAF